MSNQNDGGPAFPASHQAREGMTLRDWFAGLALQGYLAGRNSHRAENPYNFEARQASESCYLYADAMLAVRERKEDV